MTGLQLLEILSSMDGEELDNEILFRVERAQHGLTSIDYIIKETNGQRLVLAEDTGF